MKTATTFSSGFVSCAIFLSMGCGGGGGDEFTDADGLCMAATVADVNRLIAEHGPLQCRVWEVDGQTVDGAAYAEFLIGGEV